MKIIFHHFNISYFLFQVIAILINNGNASDTLKTHVWEMKEIKLIAQKTYTNYYTDVTCWVELKGPDFSKRVYGFWDGGNNFIVRIVATKPGKWKRTVTSVPFCLWT